ncbi:hypothetical protein Dimus_023768 [Dionaea muscipula]
MDHKKKKKKQNPHQNHQHCHHRDNEILKAVAQAWLSHISDASSKPLTGSEFDARRINFQPKVSRFKLETIKKAAIANEKAAASVRWDFNESLCDTYEIVAISKSLERGLLDYEFSNLGDEDGKRVVSGKSDTKINSLRNLFSMTSSRRFNEPTKQTH